MRGADSFLRSAEYMPSHTTCAWHGELLLPRHPDALALCFVHSIAHGSGLLQRSMVTPSVWQRLQGNASQAATHGEVGGGNSIAERR